MSAMWIGPIEFDYNLFLPDIYYALIYLQFRGQQCDNQCNMLDMPNLQKLLQILI